MGESYKCEKCPTKYEGNGKECQLILTDGKCMTFIALILSVLF